jgi:hypothetical protein
MTDYRRKHWVCSTVPYWSYASGRCARAYQARTAFTTAHHSMVVLNPDGFCMIHPKLDVNCETCQYVLRGIGIDLQ